MLARGTRLGRFVTSNGLAGVEPRDSCTLSSVDFLSSRGRNPDHRAVREWLLPGVSGTDWLSNPLGAGLVPLLSFSSSSELTIPIPSPTAERPFQRRARTNDKVMMGIKP